MKEWGLEAIRNGTPLSNVWIVSYWDYFSKEPVVTVFDNEEAANKCYKYFKTGNELCWLDKCPIYSHFLESEG